MGIVSAFKKLKKKEAATFDEAVNQYVAGKLDDAQAAETCRRLHIDPEVFEAAVAKVRQTAEHKATYGDLQHRKTALSAALKAQRVEEDRYKAATEAARKSHAEKMLELNPGVTQARKAVDAAEESRRWLMDNMSAELREALRNSTRTCAELSRQRDDLRSVAEGTRQLIAQAKIGSNANPESVAEHERRLDKQRARLAMQQKQLAQVERRFVDANSEREKLKAEPTGGAPRSRLEAPTTKPQTKRLSRAEFDRDKAAAKQQGYQEEVNKAVPEAVEA